MIPTMRLSFAIGACSAALLLAVFGGCSDVCEDLSDICARCVDADYKESCEATVRSAVQSVCSGQRAVFNDACPYVDDSAAAESST